MLRTSLKYGAIGGFIVLVYVSTLTYTGLTFKEGIGPVLGYLAIVIMPICTFLAIKEFKNKYSRAKLRFIDAMAVGLLVSIIAAMLYNGLRWAENNLIGNTYSDYLVETTRLAMEAEGKTSTEIDTAIKSTRDYYKSWKPFRNTLKWYTGLGTIYSLGSFFWLRYFYKPK